MSKPTPTDVERAQHLMSLPHGYRGEASTQRVAAALADEREQALLPVLRAVEAAELSIKHGAPVDFPEFIAGLRHVIDQATP